MPQLTISDLRQRLQAALASSRSARPLVLFGCDHGACCTGLGGSDVSAFSLLCTAQLPPSFVEYALRDGAAGVLVAACREGGCDFRLGERWTAERLAGLREPHLRASVAAVRIEFVFAGPGDEALLQAGLERLRRRVQPLAPETELPIRLQHA